MNTIRAPHREINRLVDQAILGVANNALTCFKLNLELLLKIRRVESLVGSVLLWQANVNVSTVIPQLVEL